MPPSQQTSSGNVVSMDASEAQQILANLRSLRRQIVEAWQSRAVMLTPEEQGQLTAEINDTRELLAELTASETRVEWAVRAQARTKTNVS